MYAAQFRFHGSLNDFLLPSRRNEVISFAFHQAPAVKDSIEALGIPHVEISEIRVGSQPAGFYYPLQQGDRVEVFPFTRPQSTSGRVILDVHLGKLARLLRLLGIDSLYRNDFSDRDIIELARKEDRVVLTRDIGLLKNKSVQWGYWLRSQDSLKQLGEVLQRFELKNAFRPFGRCLSCNGTIQAVEKRDVVEVLPPHTQKYFNEFYQCQACKKVYWKGSHYEKMLHTVAKALGIHQGNNR